MTATISPPPDRTATPAGRDGFGRLLRAEWTKFRTVRGWVIGTVAAALVTVLIGLLSAAGSHTSCGAGPGAQGGQGGGSGGCHRSGPPTGPGGKAVNDHFYLLRRSLTGNGSITARITSLTGQIPPGNPSEQAHGKVKPLREWAKAGLIVKADTKQGSQYAAIMVTGGHGVRMQYDFTHDTAGKGGQVSSADPRWLRLTRSGDTLTGYESVDGTNWTKVGAVRLSGLPSTVPAGMFVASPPVEVTDQQFGGVSSNGGPSAATADFDQVRADGGWSGGAWTGVEVGGDGGGGLPPELAAGFQQSGGRYTLRGSGDIAPGVAGPEGDTVERSLIGLFAGLITVTVLGTMFVTAEYRRGMIRTTLTASPRRGRILAAKAVVLGCVTFVTGLLASFLSVWLVGSMRRSNGQIILPVTGLTEVRVVVGTAALLAVAAVLALAVGTIMRRSAGAVATVLLLIVLPYLLGVASVLPASAANWPLRLTPAAGFAIQQSIPRYHQVAGAYFPSTGYFPLSPWAGFAVLCAWTAGALALATYLLRRRDV